MKRAVRPQPYPVCPPAAVSSTPCRLTTAHVRTRACPYTGFRPMRCANARFILVGAVTSLLGTAAVQAAQSNADAAPATDSTADASGGVLDTVVVTAQRLNEKRAGIETQTGASTYTIDDAAIAATPGGDNVQFNQVILQAPNVVQDSFGQFHVRGDHNDVQYRLDGMLCPEGIRLLAP